MANPSYQEWIYGDPPEDVDFVRLVDDEVVRLEIMKVDGEKVIQTERKSNSPPLWRRVPRLKFVPPTRPLCAAPAKKSIPTRLRRCRTLPPRPDPLGQDGRTRRTEMFSDSHFRSQISGPGSAVKSAIWNAVI